MGDSTVTVLTSLNLLLPGVKLILACTAKKKKKKGVYLHLDKISMWKDLEFWEESPQ